MGEPEWVRHAILWQIYPLGFVGAFPANSTGSSVGANPQPVGAKAISHRLPRIIAWLDHAITLGASGILLGPVFASSSHGYDTTDYFRIDPRLGDLEDFDEVVRQAKKRGLRVVLDGVFNHVGQDFPRYRDALTTGSDTANWFRKTEHGFETFEGHEALPALNHDNPEVVDFLAEVMNFWLDRGVEGWRLDAAYAIAPKVLRTVLARVRTRHPNAWFSGEVIHGDYAEFVEQSTVDSVTQYELWKAIWSSLNDGNFHELAWALTRHNGFLDSFVPTTFIGNHDVTRIASRLDHSEHIAHALVILLTVGGTPTIWAGDELGMTGVKEERTGGDDAIRPEFAAAGPSQIAGRKAEVLRLHQELIGLRRNHPWLHRAQTEILETSQTHLVYRSWAEGHAIVVALNSGEEPVTISIASHAIPTLPRGPSISEQPQSHTDGAQPRSEFVIAPRGWQVFALG